MAKTRKRRSARRKRRATPVIFRSNPVRRRKRKSTKRRTRRNAWYDNAPGHRKAAKLGWSRRKRSKRRTRKNPYHARRKNAYRRRTRRNPNIIKSITSQKTIMTAVKIGGGIAIGALAMPILFTMLPENMKNQRRWLGGIHVAIGALMVGMLRNKDLKDLGMVIAGTGVYDLIAYNVPDLGLIALPSTPGPLLANLTGTKPVITQAEEQAGLYGPLTISHYGASYGTPARSGYGASYPVAVAPVSPVARAGVGASYEAPGMNTQGFGNDLWSTDDPYAGIEW